MEGKRLIGDHRTVGRKDHSRDEIRKARSKTLTEEGEWNIRVQLRGRLRRGRQLQLNARARTQTGVRLSLYVYLS